MTLNIEEIINFISKILYIVLKNEISIDKAFQRVKARWRNLESFKVYYDIAQSVVREYYKLKYISKRLFNSESCKDIVRTWLIVEGFKYFKKRDIVEKYVKKLFKKRGLKIENLESYVLDMIEELKYVDYAQYLSIKYSYPIEFVKTLLELLHPNDVEKILESMNSQVVWLRVNTLKIDVDKCIKILESQGLRVEVDRDIPYLLRVVEARRPVHHVEAVRQFLAIPQDKASILTVHALDPQPGDYILDLCAAPGMKTSLMMQITENRVHVVAVDISRDRLRNMVYILKRCGVDIDRVDIVLGDSKILKFRKHVDKILIDAPCSSSGAIGKDPAIKIALRGLKRLRWYVDIQYGLVKNVVEQFKDIEIIYATCSLLPQEGEEIIEKIYENYSIDIVRPRISASYGYSKYRIFNKVCRTFPHLDMCEGFFISKIVC